MPPLMEQKVSHLLNHVLYQLQCFYFVSYVYSSNKNGSVRPLATCSLNKSSLQNTFLIFCMVNSEDKPKVLGAWVTVDFGDYDLT